MVQRVIVAMVDDLDGESAADETVEFAIDGVSYEIDLSAVNAEKLRSGLEPWIAGARRIRGRQRRSRAIGSSPRGKSSVDREQTAAMRAWARANGYDVSSRGRIPSNIQDDYNKARSE